MTTATASEPASSRSVWLPAAVIAGVVAAFIGIANFAVYWLGGEAQMAGFTADPTPVTVEIAGEKLAIPGNMIRFADQRQDGRWDRLDLVVHWPSLTGYSAKNASAFDDVTPNAPLLFLALQPRRDQVDSTTRLIGLYARFFEEGDKPGPAGLVSRDLQPGSGYDSEEVFFEPGSTDPFSARCSKTGERIVPVTCLRAIHIGEALAVSYRFRKPMLKDWARLDPAIRMLIDRMRIRK
ncbi:hypothetical protein [Rhodobium gokarnense]|uniref:Uncharacterized protein n=1 Tax=Rhodobium gokarnense TaxID=364296 RepID=A0ABT3HDG1_9HYPH|nr:hypothetical protein [Rhodobium gokarnense]MCW2308447.1 hypothetical protein [Rhodobium gokarnense]